jgi:hypothetical protein
MWVLFSFRGSIRSLKDSMSNYIPHYVRPFHMRPYGDRPISLKTDFWMQKLHKPVFKQNMIFFSELICHSVGFDFQHNNWILTICTPSPTAWPCSEFMARAASKLFSGHFSFFWFWVVFIFGSDLLNFLWALASWRPRVPSLWVHVYMFSFVFPFFLRAVWLWIRHGARACLKLDRFFTGCVV